MRRPLAESWRWSLRGTTEGRKAPRADVRFRVGQVLLLGVAFVLVASCDSCGGGDNPIDNASTTGFTPSSTAASPNHVRLKGAVSGDEILLSVVLDGPTTASDLFSFAFDVEISNPLVVAFVQNSEGAGTLFDGVPNILVVEAQGNRIVCGISQTGAGPGGTVSTSQATILSFKVKTIGTGVSSLTFRGSPNNPSTPTTDPAALDSSGAVITAIVFDAASARVSR